MDETVRRAFESEAAAPQADRRLTLAEQQESHTQALGRLGSRVSDLENLVEKLAGAIDELRRETGLDLPR